MLNDYKGEKPNNVIPEEEHKKRPFYKKVTFWVLSALGLFFGGCSVYGLVLGYQYVHAVTEAAHIIADANSSDDSNVSLSAKPRALVNDSSLKVSAVDLGSLTWNRIGYGAYTRSLQGLIFPIANESDSSQLVCSKYKTITRNQMGFSAPYPEDTIAQDSSSNIAIADSDFLNLTNEQIRQSLSGVYLYYRSIGDTIPANEAFYNEGYEDGSNAINLPQSVKVLLPEGNQYSVQYKSYVDGVVDQQGQLNSSQTGGAYATFDRSRTQKLRIDLTLPSGSRAFFLYTPSWTASYPTDENYSLRQSWAVSGVTYLPTWVAKPQIYVGVTPADVPDLTYETISVAFDVDHWGDIKVGAYSQGYNDGYQAGEENPTAYDSGYDAGYQQGYDDGHTLGVAQGESQAVSGQKALVNMFVTAFQQPFDQIYRFLNFNVLGLNILALFTALLTLSIGIIIIKKVI